MITTATFASALGNFTIETDGVAITRLRPAPEAPLSPHPVSPILSQAISQLNDYFTGLRKSFTLPLNISLNATPFRMKVWQQILLIPYGATISYTELALRCGNPKACRAVAQACGKNPLPILIPCHRVIASNGSLGGYVFGTPLKQHLLTIENTNN